VVAATVAIAASLSDSDELFSDPLENDIILLWETKYDCRNILNQTSLLLIKFKFSDHFFKTMTKNEKNIKLTVS